MTSPGRPRKRRKKEAGTGNALNVSLRILSRRSLSEGEIRFRLVRKGFGESETESVLGRLRELGLVDDRALCGRLAGQYRCDRRLGPGRIARMLGARYFPRDLIEEALGRIRPEEEFSAALEALQRKYRDGIPPGRGATAKAYRFLAGRGFPPETCRRAIRALSADLEEGGD